MVAIIGVSQNSAGSGSPRWPDCDSPHHATVVELPIIAPSLAVKLRAFARING